VKCDYLTSHQSSVAGESALAADVSSSSSSEKSATTKVSATKKRTSQAELLAGAVKRKRYCSGTVTKVTGVVIGYFCLLCQL